MDIRCTGSHLLAADSNGKSDVYCVLSIFDVDEDEGSDEVATQKTSVKFKTLNPVFNESLQFPLELVGPQGPKSGECTLGAQYNADLQRHPTNYSCMCLMRYAFLM